MVKPVSCSYNSPYCDQQVLDNFDITELLNRVGNFSDVNFDAAWMNLEKQEPESIVANLVQRLIANLPGGLIANYLNIMRQGSKSNLLGSINEEKES